MAERDRIYNKRAVDHKATILVALEVFGTIYFIVKCTTKNNFKSIVFFATVRKKNP